MQRNESIMQQEQQHTSVDRTVGLEEVGLQEHVKQVSARGDKMED